jgi:aminopeptidase
MSDPRVTKLAQVLVNYSLALQPGDLFYLRAAPLAQELSRAVYKEAVLAGAHILYSSGLPGSQEIFYRHANDDQLDHVSPAWRFIIENYDANLVIEATENTRELSNVDPERRQRSDRAGAEVFQLMTDRMASGELRWCYTEYPTQASAQEAEMSLSEYEEFVYGAGLLDLDDPVAAWKEEAERQNKLMRWLEGKDRVTLKGKDIDLSLSIKGRGFLNAAGKENFPDGEIYTSPIEDSVNGWVRFAYPAIFGGKEVTDIELWFEDGKVIKESAGKGADLLKAMLDMDEGARYLGEWGIGTNYGIQRFTKNILFDEKIGGTIHLALGIGFPEVGGQNTSGLHWDIICDMNDSEITVDGDLFYKDGKSVV